MVWIAEEMEGYFYNLISVTSIFDQKLNCHPFLRWRYKALVVTQQGRIVIFGSIDFRLGYEFAKVLGTIIVASLEWSYQYVCSIWLYHILYCGVTTAYVKGSFLICQAPDSCRLYLIEWYRWATGVLSIAHLPGLAKSLARPAAFEIIFLLCVSDNSQAQLLIILCLPSQNSILSMVYREYHFHFFEVHYQKLISRQFNSHGFRQYFLPGQTSFEPENVINLVRFN